MTAAAFWDNRRDQVPELGYVPLTVAESKEALPQDVVPLDLKGPDESVIGARHAEVMI